MHFDAQHGSNPTWTCLSADAPPVIYRVSDCSRSEVPTSHLIFGDAAQRVGYGLLGDSVCLIDWFAQNHLPG
jgi:hypothetical protein